MYKPNKTRFTIHGGCCLLQHVTIKLDLRELCFAMIYISPRRKRKIYNHVGIPYKDCITTRQVMTSLVLDYFATKFI